MRSPFASDERLIMGHDQLRAFFDEQAQKLDEGIREAIQIADGDVTKALRSAIVANWFLIEENEKLKTQISMGYTRKKSKQKSA